MKTTSIVWLEKSTLTLGFLLIILVGSAFAEEWKKADVYFTDWNVLTRARWTIEMVRKTAQYKKSFTNVSQIADILALHKLKPVKKKDPEDARLVVDLYTDTNHKITYYASRFRLSTEDNSWKRNLDKSFRIKIEKLLQIKQENPEGAAPGHR